MRDENRESGLTISELRMVGQPPHVLGRESAEHWAGRLYMRRVSVYVSFAAIRLGMSADAVTGLMIAFGLAGAAALSIPNLWGAVLAFLLVQIHLLLDCADGEVARWNAKTHARGIYLDRVGHYLVDAALHIMVGVRAIGLAGSPAWATLGALTAVMVLVVKAESDLADAALFNHGAQKGAREITTARGRLGALRRIARSFRLHRLLGAIELTMILVLAAIWDRIRGDLSGTRFAALALCGIAAVMVVAHLVSVLASDRLNVDA